MFIPDYEESLVEVKTSSATMAVTEEWVWVMTCPTKLQMDPELAKEQALRVNAERATKMQPELECTTLCTRCTYEVPELLSELPMWLLELHWASKTPSSLIISCGTFVSCMAWDKEAVVVGRGQSATYTAAVTGHQTTLSPLVFVYSRPQLAKIHSLYGHKF